MLPLRYTNECRMWILALCKEEKVIQKAGILLSFNETVSMANSHDFIIEF